MLCVVVGVKFFIHYTGFMKKQRLDTILVKQGFFPHADAALRAVLAHEVKVGEKYATSAAMLVDENAIISVKDQKRFVSRGGYKLQAALAAFNTPVVGLRCLDVGASTGGFTDCLLQAGAAEVSCVDVNYGQLAWALRQNGQVKVFERTNIKLADPMQIGAPFELIVADLSFIGLARLASTFARYAACGSIFIGLIKPQFESQAGETVAGVVHDAQVRRRVIAEVKEALEGVGFYVEGVIESPIKGPAGNVEYLIKAVFK